MSRRSLWYLALGLIIGATPLSAQDLFRFIAPEGTIEYDVQTGEGAGTFGIFIEEDSGNSGFPNNVGGWGMGVTLDPDLLEAAEIEQGEYLETVDPDFFAPTTYPDGFTIGCVYSFTGMGTCTYEVPKEAVLVTLVTNAASMMGDTDGAASTVDWADTLGTPPVENTIVLSTGQTGTVDPQDGMIDLVPSSGWSRGDCNADGRLNIADGIWILDALFQGGQLGSCMAACDVDGDAEVGQADSVYSFQYLFAGGAPPPAPFPACGDAPGLDCETYSVCP